MFNFAIQNVESQQSTVNGLLLGLNQKLLTNNSSFLIFLYETSNTLGRQNLYRLYQ